MLAHRAHIVLLGVALDQLHAEAQLGACRVLHVLLHCQTLQDVLMVDSYRVNRVLVRQDDARFSRFEGRSAHIHLAHARAALQVLDQVLVLGVVQKHLNLTIRFNILQYDGMSLLAPMVDMKQLLDERLQRVKLDLPTDDNVRDLGVHLVHSTLVWRLQIHQLGQLQKLDRQQVEDNVGY